MGCYGHFLTQAYLTKDAVGDSDGTYATNLCILGFNYYGILGFNYYAVLFAEPLTIIHIIYSKRITNSF